MITDMLSDVIKRGTARRANGIFKNMAVAGKTGTSRDGWFVGYTPNLVCAVWIGFDDNKQLGLTGADAALPAWIDFMRSAVDLRPSLGGTNFPKPSEIVTVRIDPETGALAGPNCPSSMVVSVSSRFASSIECWKHAPMVAAVYEDESTEYEQTGIESESETEREIATPPVQPRSLSGEKSSPTGYSQREASDLDSTRTLPIRETPRKTQSEKNLSGRPTLTTAPRVLP
jgi:membrane carboxypeptidase/penicillin-binding protein